MRINNAKDETHEQMMRMLCRFFDTEEITYAEGKTGEAYIFKNQDGKELTLQVCSNQKEGRFLTVREGSLPFDEQEEGLQLIKGPETRYAHC
jgi:hypothetical protein